MLKNDSLVPDNLIMNEDWQKQADEHNRKVKEFLESKNAE